MTENLEQIVARVIAELQREGIASPDPASSGLAVTADQNAAQVTSDSAPGSPPSRSRPPPRGRRVLPPRSRVE